jgi:hypothetical protein
MRKSILACCLGLLLSAAALSAAFGQARLIEQRPFEPVVLRGGVLDAFSGYPLNEIYLYAWDDSAGNWRMMPFQIDERVHWPDPNNPEVNRHSYFIPDTAVGFDPDDELVFMIRDMGEKAPERAWIPDPESKSFNRLELRIYDPDSVQIDAYAYLYRSSTISEPVPSPYQFIYHAAQDSIESKYYAVGLGAKTGLVEDIVIKPPFGSGQDIFDRQKIRATAALSAGPLNFRFEKVDENLIKLVPGYREVTQKPVVRLIREVRQTFNLGIALENDMAFYVTTRFYPFNGRVAGGSALDDSSLRKAMPKWDDPFILFEVLRQSWDLNANARGMLFYNKHNTAVPVDGVPDVVDLAIDKPIHDWNLVAGPQGALFSMTTLPDTVATSISLYYYDNSAGGTGDLARLGYYDTGDKASYGDFGFTMYNANSLELSFEMYFLPNTVNTVEQARSLADAIERPFKAYGSVATGISGLPGEAAPASFSLAQNYPNPFNQATSMSFTLPKAEHVRLEIFNAQGRLVRRLADWEYPGGTHRLYWDGRDDAGRALSSGVYFYQLGGDGRTVRQKLLLLR